MSVFKTMHILARGMRMGADPTCALRLVHVDLIDVHELAPSTECGDWTSVGDDLRCALKKYEEALEEQEQEHARGRRAHALTRSNPAAAGMA